VFLFQVKLKKKMSNNLHLIPLHWKQSVAISIVLNNVLKVLLMEDSKK